MGRWENAMIGQNVCKAGYKTNYTCGKVTSKYFAPSKIPNSERFVKTTTCAQPGDSGAGVFYEYRLHASPASKRYQATGILGGGPVYDDGTAYPCSHPDFFMYFSHIEYVRNAFPIAIRQLIVN